MTAGVAHFQRLGVTGPPPKVRLHGEATTPLVSPFVGHGFRVQTQTCHWGLPQCLPTMPHLFPEADSALWRGGLGVFPEPIPEVYFRE